MRKENVKNIKMSFPRNVVGNLPLSESLVKEEQQPYLIKQAEDPRQKPSGMTTLFNNGNGGFTLIELLVVVLIIGILAAVALPQYQKAVEKSKATQALALLRSLAQAATEYQLANGEAFHTFDELSVEIPWTGTESWMTPSDSNVKDRRSNGEWSLEWYRQNGSSSGTLLVGRINGKYKGAGFMLITVPNHPDADVIYCAERISLSAGVKFEQPAGSYCKEIMKGTKTSSNVGNFNFHTYALP